MSPWHHEEIARRWCDEGDAHDQGYLLWRVVSDEQTTINARYSEWLPFLSKPQSMAFLVFSLQQVKPDDLCRFR
jgi:hypothetical protein